MPLRLMDSAIHEAKTQGHATYDADADLLATTDMLEPLVDALSAQGLAVEIAGSSEALERLRLTPRVPLAGASVRIGPARGGAVRFLLRPRHRRAVGERKPAAP